MERKREIGGEKIEDKKIGEEMRLNGKNRRNMGMK